VDINPWLTLADRVRSEGAYSYSDFARDLTRQLTWTGATDVATALRGHVYGWTGGHPLHKDIKPLYDRLGWEQSALLAAWFRNHNNKPQKRPGGWPTTTPRQTKESV
jgi:hypothetical protein